MMNKKRLMAILAAGVLTATSFNPVMIKAESVSAEEAGMAVPADAAGMSVPADAAGAAVSADEAGAALVDDLLQRFLHFGAGFLRHVQELVLQPVVDQLVQTFAKDIGLPQLDGVALKILQKALD